MQVTPVLLWSFDLHAGLGREPIHLLGIGKRYRRKIDLRIERLQSDILQSVRDAGFQLCDRREASPGLHSYITFKLAKMVRGDS